MVRRRARPIKRVTILHGQVARPAPLRRRPSRRPVARASSIRSSQVRRPALTSLARLTSISLWQQPGRDSTRRALTTALRARHRRRNCAAGTAVRLSASGRGAKFFFPRTRQIASAQRKAFPHFPQARRRFLPRVEKPTDSSASAGDYRRRPLPPWGFDAAGNQLPAWGA
jgi:hypothetical protein